MRKLRLWESEAGQSHPANNYRYILEERQIQIKQKQKQKQHQRNKRMWACLTKHGDSIEWLRFYCRLDGLFEKVTLMLSQAWWEGARFLWFWGKVFQAERTASTKAELGRWLISVWKEDKLCGTKRFIQYHSYAFDTVDVRHLLSWLPLKISRHWCVSLQQPRDCCLFQRTGTHYQEGGRTLPELTVL